MTDLIVAAVAGLGVGIVLGMCIGLYLGERARRIAAENFRVYGSATAQPARILPPKPDAESRASSADYSRETVERGAERLMTMAKEQGRTLTRKDAVTQAEAMLHPDAPFEMGL